MSPTGVGNIRVSAALTGRRGRGWLSGMSKRPDAWREAVERFPAALRPELDALWSRGGRLAPDVVARLRWDCGGDLARLMVRLLPLAAQYATAPLSAYRVGAVAAGVCAEGQSPTLYFGANLEFPGLALNYTVHAEQSAVNHAWLCGERSLSALAVSAAPCGHCRQFLNEATPDGSLPLHLPGPIPGEVSTLLLKELLPQAFGPADLGVRGGLLGTPRRANLRVGRDAGRDPLVAAALAAARTSYSPYRAGRARPLAGVAIELADGSTVTGRLAANAAYNPGLLPLSAALAFARLQHPPGAPLRVRRCVLVERSAESGQRLATAALLAAIAPRVRLEHHEVGR